ncbi:MAG: hypothetical protein CMK59_11245 [Proteobacteria bacterium]|nr:hypothetical protein [Pseudomonadota bacterium]
MKHHRLSRRDLLQKLGLGMGSVPLMLRSGKAWANNAPQRLIVVFTQHGTWYEGWKMRQGALPEDQHWDFQLPSSIHEFSESLSPLHPFRDKMMVVDGLAMLSAELDGSGLRHELGQVHALTGANMKLLSGVPLGSAPSIDQIIAAQIADPGQIPSLEYGIGDPPISVNYSGPLELLPMTTDPLIAYQTLFGITSDASSLTGGLQAQQIRILQAATERYSALSSKLGTDGKRKLEDHRDLMSDLSIQIEGLELRRAQCTNINNQEGFEFAGSEFPYEDDYWIFSQYVSMAFACDLSRVATLHLGQLSGDQVLGQFVDIHNNYAHEVWTNPNAAQAMIRYSQIHSEHVALLASKLDSIVDPYGDGVQTLLDNTMILWVSELGDGAHGFEKWPAVVVGGNAFSSFKYGRYIHHPSNLPVYGKSWLGQLPAMGQPHQKLLVSVAQQFGLDQNSIGERSLIASDGSTIDCTGPLQGLI